MNDDDLAFLLVLALLMILFGIVLGVGLYLFDRWLP